MTLPGSPTGDARGAHALDPDGPSDDDPPFHRPGDLGDVPSAGDFAALAREVRALMQIWRESIMPMLTKLTLEAEAIRKEMTGFLAAIHSQGREIDALRKTDADLAISHDAARHLITERVSRTELAITELRSKLELVSQAPAPAKRKPASSTARRSR